MLKSENTDIIRLVLTVLTCSRSMTLPVKVDTSTITAPSRNRVLSSVYSRYLPGFWEFITRKKQGKYRLDPAPWWSEYHFSTKSGPNGPAMWSAFEDLSLLIGTELLESIRYIGGYQLSQNLDVLVDFLPDFRKQFTLKREGTELRKLVGIPDKEGKTRVIAILDYFSQTSLKPVHSALFRYLRKIRQDVTFNQGSYQEIVNS